MGTEEGGRGYVSHKGTEGSEAAGQARLAQRGNILYFSFFPCVPRIPWLVILFIMRNEPRNTRKTQKGNQCTVLRILDYHVQILPPRVQFYLTGARRGSRNPNCPNTSRRRKPAFCCCFEKYANFSKKQQKYV